MFYCSLRRCYPKVRICLGSCLSNLSGLVLSALYQKPYLSTDALVIQLINFSSDDLEMVIFVDGHVGNVVMEVLKHWSVSWTGKLLISDF